MDSSPYRVLRYTASGGQVVEQEILLKGRKVSLHDIRTQLLMRQEQFMRIETDQHLELLQPDELIPFFHDHNLTLNGHMTTSEMQEVVASCQRHRHLAMWHDHSTILNKGMIMVTVNVLYDRAVFLSNEEYHQKSGRSVNVQAEVEQPAVYMLTLGSSSVEDQSALIPERVECLPEMAHPISASNGKHKYMYMYQ